VEWGSIVALDIWAILSRQENLVSYFHLENRMRWILAEENYSLFATAIFLIIRGCS